MSKLEAALGYVGDNLLFIVRTTKC